jgi:DNA-binding CsgD family transcriptional regulator
VPARATELLLGLSEHYQLNKVCDFGAWSLCELSRLQAQAGDAQSALPALRGARQRLPLQGFSPVREQLDFHESLLHRQLGDHRQALFAYQRYAQRTLARRLSVPANFQDQSLFDAAARLVHGARRTSFASARGKASRETEDSTTLPGTEAAPADSGPPGPSGLTDREADVLRLIVEGLGNRQVADRLCLSQNTDRKLKVQNRQQAVVVAAALMGRA